MKQIPLLQGKALLVELPEGATDPFVAKTYVDEDGHTYDTDPQWLEWSGTFPNNTLDLPPGNWRIIGMLSEVTDDDLINIIDVLVSSKSGKCLFPNFTGGPWKTNRIESLESAIEAEGYYFSNPLGKEKEYKKSYTWHDMFFANHMVKYYEAQSRVLDRSRCLLLGRED